jgi:hypothetical protein
MGTRGVIAAFSVFMLGSVIAWYSWTQQARVRVFHMEPYSPPPLYILAGLAAILLLVFAAYLLPASPASKRTSPPAPSPRSLSIVACLLGTPWVAYVAVGFGNWPGIPFQWALLSGLVWAGLAVILVERWSTAPNWSDAHRYALVFGGVVACMLGGFLMYQMGFGASRVDWIGKIVLNMAALAWLIRVRRRWPRTTNG